MKRVKPKRGKAERIAASWKIENLRRKAQRARNFPTNTDPCSRHLYLIADALVSKRRKHPIEELWEPEHMAQTMYAVCASLWKARTEAARRLERK